MQVERFFHIRCALGDSKGGATVRVSGDTDFVGSVNVQSIECSAKDNYSRAKGRSLVKLAPINDVPLRQLPEYIAGVSKAARKHKRIGFGQTNFEYAIKYFLPK